MQENLSDTYNDVLEEYYRLKREYDHNYNSKKQIIKNKDISLKEKRELLRKIKLPCVHCKKRVGTIFTNKDGVLKAVCGGSSPCSLHIVIKKADTRYLPTVIDNVNNIIQKIQQEIIETKLDFLFGLETETETIALFESLKEKFNKASKLLINLGGIIQMSYANKERNAEIEAATLQLYLENEQFGNAIAEYKKTQKTSFLSDAIEIYITKILILQEQIQHNKYADIYVDKEDKDGIVILNKDPPIAYVLKSPFITIRQQEHQWEAGII